jgi:methane monooxygenase PmoA-like
MGEDHKTLKAILILCSVLCLASSVSPQTRAARKTFLLTVTAGPFDRRQAVVSFDLPAGLGGRSYGLRDDAGALTLLQVNTQRQAMFVLPELKAGATREFRLVAFPSKSPIAREAVQLTQADGKLSITVEGRQVLSYQTQPAELPRGDIKPIFKRGGYIHPVFTPAGRAVTDDYPPDHRHHHGIWFAWTKTEFEGRHPDFWNMGDGTGKVEFAAIDETWSGSVSAGFKASQRFVDSSSPQPKTVLTEKWVVTVYRAGHGSKSYSMFDLVSVQECATASPLTLPEYHYGGIGFRGNRQWLGKDNCFFMSSEGKDRSNAHATRARWCHVGGKVDGQLAGIAILDHPDNFRAPQPMRIHPDQPFFCYAPSQLGQWQIDPGKPYVSRYRFVVYDGPPDKDELDRLWNDYANPPRTTITTR